MYSPNPTPLHRWTWKSAFRSHTRCGCRSHRCQTVIRRLRSHVIRPPATRVRAAASDDVACLQQELDDHDVSPHAVEPSMTLIRADLAKAERSHQPSTRLVLDEDARNEFPVA